VPSGNENHRTGHGEPEQNTSRSKDRSAKAEGSKSTAGVPLTQDTVVIQSDTY